MSVLATNHQPTLNDPFKEQPELTAFEIEELRDEFEQDVISNWQKHTPQLADEIDIMQVKIGLHQHDGQDYIERYIALLHVATDLAFERFVVEKKESVIQKRYEVDYE